VTVAVITAKEKANMNEIPEKGANNEGNASAVEPTPAKKPHVAAHARHVGSSKRRSAREGR